MLFRQKPKRTTYGLRYIERQYGDHPLSGPWFEVVRYIWRGKRLEDTCTLYLGKDLSFARQLIASMERYEKTANNLTSIPE